MPLSSLAAARKKSSSDYRNLVQSMGRGEEVDPESVERILMLAGKSFAALESDVRLLEKSLSDLLAFDEKQFDLQIKKHEAFIPEAAKAREKIEVDQAALAERWKQLRELEERSRHANNLRRVRDVAQNEMLEARRRSLGTTSLDEFPLID